MKIRLGQYFDKCIACTIRTSSECFGKISDKNLSGFSIKTTMFKKIKILVEKSCNHVLTVLQCSLATTYEANPWSSSRHYELTIGVFITIIIRIILIKCKARDGKNTTSRYSFYLVCDIFFCAMDCYVCAGALSWKVNIDYRMILARWTFLAIIYRCIVPCIIVSL